MRILFFLLMAPIYAFTLVNPEEKKQNQEICETVKFPGGDTAFYKFVYSNLDSKILKKYPDLNGTIYIGFIVDTAGKIISTEILANRLNVPDSSKIIKEIRRVLLTSPKWEFYDLITGDIDYDADKDYDIDEIAFDEMRPVDDLPVNKTTDKTISKENSTQKCKKKKVKLIYPFRFPIPNLYLENKK
jgi:hypothetical protein